MCIRDRLKGAALGALLASTAAIAPATAQDSVYIANNAYRTGPFSGSGIPIGDGMRDYMTMINERDGGVNGVKINFEECETGYDTKKSIECYEPVSYTHLDVYKRQASCGAPARTSPSRWRSWR